MLNEVNVDYILDASNFPQPVSLLARVSPDILLLNMKMRCNEAINLVASNMQEDADLRTAMITSSISAFYMSLCSTLGSQYYIHRCTNLEVIPETISRQQLN